MLLGARADERVEDEAVTITVLAVLTLVAQAALVVVAGAWLAERLGAGRAWSWICGAVERDALRLAWLVALVATAGSLVFSEHLHFQPCVLCWYQRIATYPLVIVLGVAALVDDRRIARYVAPITVLGAAISAYHVQLERFPDQQQIACSATVPCTTIWFERFGYVTIPVMAGTALLSISVLVLVAWRGRNDGEPRVGA